MPKKHKPPAPPRKPVSLTFKNLEVDFDAAGLEKPQWAPEPGETLADTISRTLERMGVSFFRALAFGQVYMDEPEGEVAQIVDKALSGDARARAKLRGPKSSKSDDAS